MKALKLLILFLISASAPLFAPLVTGVDNRSSVPVYLTPNFKGTDWSAFDHYVKPGQPLAAGSTTVIPAKTSMYNLWFPIPPAWKDDPRQYIEVRVASSPEQKFYIQYLEDYNGAPKKPRFVANPTFSAAQSIGVANTEQDVLLVIEDMPVQTFQEITEQLKDDTAPLKAEEIKRNFPGFLFY